MNTRVRRKLEMAKRVREFTRAHAVNEPGYGPALTRLEELLTSADAIASRQHEGMVHARVARARREDLRQMLHGQLVHYLVAVGVAAARGKSELAEQFKLPATNATNTVFLTAVKALLAAGGEQRELLVQEGMNASLLEDLNKMVPEFEAAIEAQSTARRDHIGARADLEDITAELVEQINVLDGATRYRFGRDPEVMAEWKAARRVLGLPQDEGTPPTAGPGDVKQAA